LGSYPLRLLAGGCAEQDAGAIGIKHFGLRSFLNTEQLSPGSETRSTAVSSSSEAIIGLPRSIARNRLPHARAAKVSPTQITTGRLPQKRRSQQYARHAPIDRRRNRRTMAGEVLRDGQPRSKFQALGATPRVRHTRFGAGLGEILPDRLRPPACDAALADGPGPLVNVLVHSVIACCERSLRAACGRNQFPSRLSRRPARRWRCKAMPRWFGLTVSPNSRDR
jgi:hypothetical protein